MNANATSFPLRFLLNNSLTRSMGLESADAAQLFRSVPPPLPMSLTCRPGWARRNFLSRPETSKPIAGPLALGCSPFRGRIVVLQKAEVNDSRGSCPEEPTGIRKSRELRCDAADHHATAQRMIAPPRAGTRVRPVRDVPCRARAAAAGLGPRMTGAEDGMHSSAPSAPERAHWTRNAPPGNQTESGDLGAGDRRALPRLVAGGGLASTVPAPPCPPPSAGGGRLVLLRRRCRWCCSRRRRRGVRVPPLAVLEELVDSLSGILR